MQRFKAERRLKFERGQRMAIGYGAADRHGRFVYGATGTLTKAARYRITAFKMMEQAAGRHEVTIPMDAPRKLLKIARSHIVISRHEGCLLP